MSDDPVNAADVLNEALASEGMLRYPKGDVLGEVQADALLAFGGGDDIVIRASDGTIWRQPESVTDAYCADPVQP